MYITHIRLLQGVSENIITAFVNMTCTETIKANMTFGADGKSVLQTNAVLYIYSSYLRQVHKASMTLVANARSIL